MTSSFKKPPCRLILRNKVSTTDLLTNIQRSDRWLKQERERRKFPSSSMKNRSRLDAASSSPLEFSLIKKSLSSMSDVWFWLRPVGIKSNSGLWNSSLELFPTMTTETEELKTLADLKTSPSSLRLSLTRSDRRQKDRRKTNCLLLLSNFSVHLSVRLLSVSASVSWSVLHRWRPAGGAVRTPCPALSSSGWPEQSGRWASRSDRPLQEDEQTVQVRFHSLHLTVTFCYMTWWRRGTHLWIHLQ